MKNLKYLFIFIARLLVEMVIVYFVVKETGIMTGVFCVLVFISLEFTGLMFGKIGMRFIAHETNLQSKVAQFGKNIPTLDDLSKIEFTEAQFTISEAAMAQRMDAGDLTIVPNLMASRAIQKEYDFGAISLNDIEPFIRKMVDAVNSGSMKREEGNVLNYAEDFPQDVEFDKDDDFPNIIDVDDNLH